MNVKLPQYFKYQTAKDLIRLGRNNDGGYLVSESDIESSEILIGLGINDDWSFEEDFSRKKKIPILAFDASVSLKVYLRNLITSIVRIDKPYLFFHWLKTIFSYLKFFKNEIRHIKQFVGIDYSLLHTSLSSIIDNVGDKNIFLKVDVEGSEYRFLDTLLDKQSQITGLVIEFHDCDIHSDLIEKFIKKTSLKLVHIHANNYAPVRLDSNLPLVLELTFSKNAPLEKKAILPHNLDMPNDPSSEEFFIQV